jgi:hypothetical protein
MAKKNSKEQETLKINTEAEKSKKSSNSTQKHKKTLKINTEAQKSKKSSNSTQKVKINTPPEINSP